MSDKELTALGAYIFAGGFHIGVEKHFSVLAHFEDGMYGVRTFRLNRPWVPVYPNVEQWPIEKYAGKVNLVFTNPPCALFSSAGLSIKNGLDNWRTDPRQQCIRNCFSLLEKLRPDVLVIESVPRAFTLGRELFEELAEKAHEQGYGVTHLLENAANHNTPQVRRRYLFIAHRYALTPAPLNWSPAPTVRETLANVSDPGYCRPIRTSHKKYYDALGVNPDGPNHGIRPLWEKDNPPDTWRKGPTGVIGRPRMMEHRIPNDKPMGAFIGDFCIHPTEPRNLGLNEAKALCGFPQDWRFHSLPGAFSELARGVMPNVAEWLARSVKLSIEQGQVAELRQNVLDLTEPPKESCLQDLAM